MSRTRAPHEAAPIYQLIYVSASDSDIGDEALDRILARAREKNARLGVTGMLLYDEGSFIQLLEGEHAEVVEALFRTIADDHRHGHVRVLFRGAAPGRLFESWTMGFARTSQMSPEVLAGFRRDLPSDWTDDPNLCGRVQRVLVGFREGRWRQVART